MAMTRTVPDPKGTFEKLFTPAGDYVADIVAIKETDKQGNRLQNVFFDKQKGQEVHRDAIVLVMNIVEALPAQDDDGNWVITEDRLDCVGREIGKKMTDSMHEKAQLYATWVTVMGKKPAVGEPVDLERLKRRVVVTMLDNSKYNTEGVFVESSYVSAISKYIPPQAAQPAPRPQRQVTPPPPPAPADDDYDDQDVPF